MARVLRLLHVPALILLMVAFSLPVQAQSPSSINHIVVIYLENHSFDNLYGAMPGANGIANAGDRAKQVDKNGVPFATLPSGPSLLPGAAPDRWRQDG